MKTKVSVVKCSDYQSNRVIESVYEAIEKIGGIEKFVKPGERILLKPNLLSARVPERAVTTHPEIARAVIRLVKKAGGIPILGDSPGGAVKGVSRVWKETGMLKLCDEEDIQLINFETSGAIEREIDHPAIHKIHLSRVPLGVDGIINLPKLKTHTLMLFTGAVKNLYGCIPGLRKAEYHKYSPRTIDFANLLGEIYLILKSKIRFNLIDGITGMEGNGPGNGDLKNLGVIFASEDALALDTAITHLLGFDPSRIETNNYLRKCNAGEGNLLNIDIIGYDPEKIKLGGFKFPTNWQINLIPQSLIRFLGKHIWMKPVIIPEICENCSLCVNSCPVKAITKYGKEKPIVNMETCISCLCCHELCPCNSIELKLSFLARLIARRK